MLVEQEKSRRIQNQLEPQFDLGKPVTANLFNLLHCAAEDAPFAA